MRIVSLNLQRGEGGQALLDYMHEQAKTADVFCFQEFVPAQGHGLLSPVSRAALRGVCDIVSGWNSALYPNNHGSDGACNYNAIFSKSWMYESDSQVVIDRTPRRTVLWAQVASETDPVHVVTTHGYWNHSKFDSELRLLQAKNTRALLDRLQTPVVCMGDFNFRPDTQSYRITRGDWSELVMESKVKTTRSSRYTGTEPYADYCFVSPGLKVVSFSVPDVLASDHLPLELEVTRS